MLDLNLVSAPFGIGGRTRYDGADDLDENLDTVFSLDVAFGTVASWPYGKHV